jgi:hypothetical protein
MMPVPYPVPGLTPEQARQLDEARGDVAKLREAFADLQKQLDGQRALIRALFDLLREGHGLTEAQLLDHFRRVVAARAAAPPKVCSACGRPVSLRHQRCLYCGADQPAASAFELV